MNRRVGRHLALAGWLRLPRASAAARFRRIFPPAEGPRCRRRVSALRVAGLVATGGWLAVRTGGLAALVVLGLAGVAYRFIRAGRQRQARAAAIQAAVPGFVAALADELRAGAAPADALQAAASCAGPLRDALTRLAVARRSAQASAAGLLDLSTTAGAQGLATVAGCWAAAARCGARPAEVLDGVAAALLAAEISRAEAIAELAGTRAASGVLSLLPIAGLALAAAAGGHPLQFLLQTGAGRLTLAVAAGLDLLGWRWAQLVLRRAAGTDRAVTPARRFAQTALLVLVSALAVLATAPGAAAVPLAVAVLWYGLRRGRARPGSAAGLAEDADLPLALDLLAACRRAGLTPPDALLTVATATPGPLGAALRDAAARLTGGSGAGRAYSGWAADADLGQAARTLIRCAQTGAPAAGALARLAARCRARRAAERRMRIHRAALAGLAPLTCCFLPAFLLTGVVPLAVSLFGQLPRLAGR